jgi:hypothetical protein
MDIYQPIQQLVILQIGQKLSIGYCDGTLHQGYRKVPISYKG